MDLNSRPPWSNKALGRLGEALREGRTPPTSCPDYAEVMLWHIDLAAEVQGQIATGSWATRDELLATEARRIEKDLLIGSRAKTEDTLVQKLRRQHDLKLNSIQDIAGVRVDADLLLGEQTNLAREIAEHFGVDESAIHDLRDGAHAGYRAVHVWLRLPAGRVEVQIRTLLQTLWANAFERMADDVGRGIRYGEPVQRTPYPGVSIAEIEEMVSKMRETSDAIAVAERQWQEYADRGDMTMLGVVSMNKAMMLAAILLTLRGEIDPSKWSL